MRSILRGIVAAGTAISLAIAGFTQAGVLHQVAAQGNQAAGASVDWARFGNTTDNTRFSTLTQVNSGNVSKLGVAWTMQEGPNLTAFEDDPVVVNGVMYIATGINQVRAVNAATGKMIWQFTPKVDFYKAIHGGGGGSPTSRGVEVFNNTVYELTYDNQLIALQAATGEKLWSTVIADASLGYSETSPPTYWNGLLFTGSAASDNGERGFVAAFDAKTGKQVWRFYTVPTPGHGWMPKLGQHGGGDVWMPPVVDTKTGMLYFGTGNPSPDFNNSMRPGCNPWVNALVALDARTGKLKWAHTEVCNDVWDYDSHQPPMIFNATINGKTVRAVGHGNKVGLFFVYDAATGKVLAQSTYIAKYSVPHLKPSPKGSVVCPGAAGGIEYSPPAYSPMTQLAYEPGLNLCDIFTVNPPSEANLHKVGGVDTNGSALPAPGAAGKGSGVMVGIDVRTGKFAWRDQLPGPLVGGTLATAGNLVFSGSDDGHFYAFDATTGKILWKPNLGLGMGAAPIAFAVNGTEYIAIAAGGSIISAIDGAKLGGTMVVFKLGGAPIKPLPAATAGKAPVVGLPSVKGLTRLNPWMYANVKGQSLILKMVAAATPDNSGFNFDGYSKGKANFVFPPGWAVTIEFSNKAAIPHSLAVTSTNKLGYKLPAFGFGPVITPNAFTGIGPGVTQVVGFNTGLPSRAYFACLVPGHLQSGMWDYFTVSSTAKMPSIQVTK